MTPSTTQRLTVRQLADLSGVTVRTLHHYHAIGLLEPTEIGLNGYRYYGDEAVLRLQQILFLRELGFGLDDIRHSLDAAGFDLVRALCGHRQALAAKVARLNRLIQTVDQTIQHLNGEITMPPKKLFAGFTPEEEKRYAQEAREQYDPAMVDASYTLWNSYSKEKKAAIMAEGQAVYTDLIAAMPLGPASPEVQAIVARWHQHLRYFYEPTVEILRGLSRLYVDDARFAANFAAMHPDLAAFMQQAIGRYCDGLENQVS